MSERSTDNIQSTPDQASRLHARVRKEVIIAAVCLGLGFILLPAMIYGVGVKMLGDYGGGPHVGSFYGDFFRNLVSGTARSWLIGFAPYLMLSILRLIFWPWGRKSPPLVAAPASHGAQPSAAQPGHLAKRREPFVAP